MVFEKTVKPLLQKFFEGENVSIFAYGQTCTGKTYTIGTDAQDIPNFDLLPSTAGIIPRALYAIFNHQSEPDVEYAYRATFLEVYNEECRDLCNKSQRLFIRETLNGFVVNGLSRYRVTSMADCLSVLSRGGKLRQTDATKMNVASSRSHAIFSLILTKTYGHTHSKFGNTDTIKINFIDLAGSERLNRTLAIGDRAKEGIAINKSLLALSNVINALAEKRVFVPYRDSCLTMLLKDSLCGKAYTLMISCISPESEDYSETISTLQYANRAKNIKLQPLKRCNSAPANLMEELLKQNTELKAKLVAMHNKEKAKPDVSSIVELAECEITELVQLVTELENALCVRHKVLDKFCRHRMKVRFF
ncbi:hypothetical protein Ciccas_000696 [Cichlidogyrus casuarinus]|uniref:Kinesin motor domain-containing protein n=1 Tax=Cichlidogyrus casuarinus TaxID=1844966 RepID=A0ABD2QPE0_9PLAT